MDVSRYIGGVCSRRRDTRLKEDFKRPEKPTQAETRWSRLVISIHTIRKLQQVFHNTGERLKDFPKRLRDRVSKTHPVEKEK